MRLIHWLFAICLFTSSFDIFLVFTLGGTVRFAQLVMVLVCVGALAKAAQSGQIEWPIGGAWLLMWCGVQVLFLPVSIDLGFSTRYLMFLFFTVACFFAVVQLYGNSRYIERLMKAYLASYVFIALFGFFQLLVPFIYPGGVLVMQWIIHGKLARINGFCYEPSYYATYLITGWIALVDLRQSKAKLTAAPRWRWLTIIVGSALFLSTSKTAWIFMMLEGVARAVPLMWSWIKSVGTRLSAGRLVVMKPRWRLILLSTVGLIIAGVALVGLNAAVNLNTFLQGTGVNNTAAHSVDKRSSDFRATVAVFEEHPFIGRSLGGVSSRLSERLGVVNDGKTNLGFPVIMDVLTASGVIGFIPFLLFLGTNTIGLFPMIRRRWPEERAKWLRALVRATIYLWLVLSVDQNVLRIYLWFHMSIVAAVALHLRRRPDWVAESAMFATGVDNVSGIFQRKQPQRYKVVKGIDD
jgi:hypothetical protein